MRGVNVHINGIAPITCGSMPVRCSNVGTTFRTIDGSCNNRDHPEWGMPFRRYNRLLESDYGDGYSVPVLAESGNALPSARNVSIHLNPESSKSDVRYTIANMQLGQFVSHDTSLVAGSTASCEYQVQ